MIEFYGVVRDTWPTWMSLWTYPLLYGLGPLLYQLARGNLAIPGKKLDLRSTTWIVLSVYLVFIPFFFINYQAEDLVACSQQLPLYYRFILALLIYPATYQLHTIIWLIVAYRRLRRFQASTQHTTFTNQLMQSRQRTFRLLLALLLAYFAIGITYELLHLQRQSVDFLPYIYLNLSLSLLLQGFAYLILLRPELLRNLKPVHTEKKYERDLIPAETLPEYAKQLAKYWEEQPYLSDEFQLEELAQQLALSKNQASQLVNRMYGMSFSKWVKSARIAHALAYWEQHSNGKLPRVKDMIFSSGFQNTVSFYRAFKEVTGESFPDFRERQKKNITSYE